MDNTTVNQHLAPAHEADSVLTTEEAARLVNISHPYMVKLIAAGAIALYQQVDNQRRVLRSAVMQWHTEERARQAKALKRMSESLSEEIFPDYFNNNGNYSAVLKAASKSEIVSR